MTALAQGMAGLALVMGFALLCIRQIRAASILLCVQSAAVAVSAVVLHQPLLAIPPVLLAAGAWFAPGHFAIREPRTAPAGGAKLGVGAGAALAVLCQSQGGLALPLAVILLSVLLAATRRHVLMHVMALVGIQNGVVLAASLVTQAGIPFAAGTLSATGVLSATLLPVACFVLPLPLALGALAPALTRRKGRPANWFGWIDLGLSLTVFAATLLVPLDSVASVFAPLLALDGVLRSWQRRKRRAMAPSTRSLAFLTSVSLVVAVCPPRPILAWVAVFAAITASLLPTLTRRRDDAVLAFVGAGIALFGLFLLTLAPSLLGFFSVFIGFAAIAAVVPDLAVVLVVLILRLANQTPWPPSAEAVGIAIALIALLACAFLLRGKSSAASVPLLELSQASIAALSLSLGYADGRFAALVLLILLILSRSATRITDAPVAGLAVAGLGGIPPVGVFPGLVLVVLAVASHDAWLLLPMGLAWVPILLASMPRHLPAFSPKAAVPSLGWLPLALALLTGYFTPDGLVRWWHVLTAGHS